MAAADTTRLARSSALHAVDEAKCALHAVYTKLAARYSGKRRGPKYRAYRMTPLDHLRSLPVSCASGRRPARSPPLSRRRRCCCFAISWRPVAFIHIERPRGTRRESCVCVCSLLLYLVGFKLYAFLARSHAGTYLIGRRAEKPAWPGLFSSCFFALVFAASSALLLLLFRHRRRCGSLRNFRRLRRLSSFVLR